MSGSKGVTTILLALVVAAVIGVGAWLFYFSPTFDAIEQTSSEIASQKDLNFTLGLQRDQLAAEFKMLPETIDEIVDVADDIPPVEETPTFAITINDIVTRNGLLVQDLTIADPTPTLNVVVLEAAATALEDSDYVSYVEDLEFQGLVRTPFSVTFIGPWSQVMNIVRELQSGEHRYVLVDAYVSQRLEPAEAAPPRPAVGAGWFEVTVGGYFFTQLFEGVNPNQKLVDQTLAELVEEAIENGATVPVDPNAPPPPPPSDDTETEAETGDV